MTSSTDFWVSQALVGVAFIFDAVSFQLKERRAILVCLIISSTLFGVHFLILEKITAGAFIFLATARFFVSYFTTKRRFMFIFMALVPVVLISTYQGPISLLAGAASLTGTWGSFHPTDKRLRQAMMIGTSLWIVHNVLVRSPMAALTEIFFLLSNLLGYYRFYIRAAGVDTTV